MLAANIESSIGLDAREPGRELRTVINQFHMDEISIHGHFLCPFFGALLKLKRKSVILDLNEERAIATTLFHHYKSVHVALI